MQSDLLIIQVSGHSLQVMINGWAILGILVILVGWIIVRGRFFDRFKSDIELEIKLGGIGKVKIKPNHEVKQIAHKAWVELKTRKAGLLIDKDNDVISDVYKSWYFLFGEIRTLTRDIPASKLNDQDTKILVDLLVDTLNDGLRPHLTRWRAKYERWYDKAVSKDDHDELTPQDIQSRYPEYEELVKDMMKINRQLVDYTAEIKKLVDS